MAHLKQPRKKQPTKQSDALRRAKTEFNRAVANHDSLSRRTQFRMVRKPKGLTL